MSSLVASMRNAIGGLETTREQMRLASTNVANADSPGYATRTGIQSSVQDGQVGAVRFVGIERAQDAALQREARQEAATSQGLNVRVSSAERLTNLIGQPQEQGSLGYEMAEFEASLSSLADSPSDGTLQAEAIGHARDVVRNFSELSQAIQTEREAADRRISEEVNKINSALAKIDELNEKISNGVTAGRDVASMQDERERQIDIVAERMPVDVVTQSPDKVNLYTKTGVTLVDESAREIQFTRTATISGSMVYDPSGSPAAGYTAPLSGLTVDGVDITPTGNGSQKVSDGLVSGLFEVRDNDMMTAQKQVDGLAEELVIGFQDLSVDPTLDTDADSVPDAPGLFTDPNAAPGPGGWYQDNAGDQVDLASRISLNAAVDPQQGGDSALLRDGANASTALESGDGSQVQRYADLMTEGDRASDMGGAPASFIQAAEDLAATQQAARGDLDNRAGIAQQRADVAADARNDMQQVDVDKQLQRIMELQRSYQASARVLSIVDSMFEEMLAVTR